MLTPFRRLERARVSLEEAKARLPIAALWRKFNFPWEPTRSCRCPFHEDRSASFSVYIGSNGAPLWKCFAGCGQGGPVEFLALARGISEREACRELIELAGGTAPTGEAIARQSKQAAPFQSRVTSRSVVQPYRLTDSEIARGIGMAERLIANNGACEAIALHRGWQSQTILGLAQEASLGLSEKEHLVFLYDTGAKERWDDENGERQIRFLFGKADALWRGGLLSIPGRERVLITEGETDAISLIDADVERDGKTLVVALPGASIFKPHWTAQLAGKDVVLCLDADAAGRKATEKLENFLAAHVASLKTVDLGALLK